MLQKIKFLIFNFFLWVALSIVAKIVFLSYHAAQSAALSIGEVGKIIFYGLSMDLSLAGYTTLLFSVLMLLTALLKPKAMKIVCRVFGVILLLFFSIVSFIDLELFASWGYHLDTTPLSYLKTPSAITASTPIGTMLTLLTIGIVMFVLGYFAFNKYVVSQLRYERFRWFEAPIYLLLGGVMIIPIRGGFNVAPMNSSFVFFHPTNMYANQAAINPVWNFIYELAHIKNESSHYKYFDSKEEVDALVIRNIKGEKTTKHLLNKSMPNIVFVLLESFSATAIESLGGVKGATPNLDALAAEGVSFTNIYATAGRSDRGLVAAISAIPSSPDIAIIRDAARVASMPRFTSELAQLGYNTAFYYAGDINFGSFRSYATMSFEKIVTEDDFSGEAIENRFKWGVHDHYMFDKLYEDISSAKEPFCYVAFNMSSHEPFDVPHSSRFSGDDVRSLYLNSVHYTDECIGKFTEKCKESGLWDNTLFVFMADHGVRIVGDYSPDQSIMYHIPLIFTGGVLSEKNLRIDTLGSQVDMIATLFGQLGLDYSQFTFSRNLLSDSKVANFAPYSFSNYAYAVTDNGEIMFDIKNNTFSRTTNSSDEKLFKAMFQRTDEVTKR